MESTNKTNQNSVYKKISNIQNSNEEIKKDGINRFQNYKFFSKEQVLRKLKPLFDEQNLIVIISDNNVVAEYIKEEKEYSVKFLKNIRIVDLEDTSSEVNLNF